MLSKKLIIIFLITLSRYIAHTQSQNIPPQLLFRRMELSSISSSPDHPHSTFPPSFSSTLPPPKCNDGTIPSIYYRNCSANWDRKPGDPDFCNVTIKRWIIDFTVTNRDYLTNGIDQQPKHVTSFHNDSTTNTLVDGYYCYNDISCSQRSINLTTSNNLPDIAFPSGIALPYAEANPNLYKSHHVIVPYCSSDLYFGNSSIVNYTTINQTWYFYGYNILWNVIDTLIYNLDTDSLLYADEIIFIGPLGIQITIPAIQQYIQEKKQVFLSSINTNTNTTSTVINITSICDGCGLITDVSLPIPIPIQNCTRDNNCPYSLSLPLVINNFNDTNSYLTRPYWCNLLDSDSLWKCFTAEYFLVNFTNYLRNYNTNTNRIDQSLSSSLSNSFIEWFIYIPQYDQLMFELYNLWDTIYYNNTINYNSTGIKWAETLYAPHIRDIVYAILLENSESEPFLQIYSSAQLEIGSSSSIVLSPNYYSTLCNCTNVYNYTYKDNVNEAITSLILDNGMDQLQCMDKCLYINCHA